MHRAMASALKGVLERAKGGKATRFQALVAGVGAGVAVYKLLRSGASGDDDAGDAREGQETSRGD